MKDRNVAGFARRHPRTIGFIAMIAVIAIAVYDVGDRAHKNRVAIEKSCVLLNNAIIRSGAAGGEASRILIEEILRNARLNGRAYVEVKYKNSLGQVKQIQIVNCEEISRHPDQIKADPLPVPRRTQ